MARAEDVHLTANPPKLYRKRGDSGALRLQYFCPECGSLLFTTGEGEDAAIWGIRLGTIARYQDGQPFSRLVIVNGLNQGTEAIRAFSNGLSRFTYRATLDARLQKAIAIGQGLGQRLSVEVVGGTLDMPANASKSSPAVGGIIFAPRHLEPSGRPCLTVNPIAQRQSINKSIFDQILLLDNRCGKEIRIRVCYYKTDSCKTMAVGGYKRQQQILALFTHDIVNQVFRGSGKNETSGTIDEDQQKTQGE